MSDGCARRATHGGADRTGDHGAGDGAGGGALLDGLTAGGQGEGGKQDGHGAAHDEILQTGRTSGELDGSSCDDAPPLRLCSP